MPKLSEVPIASGRVPSIGLPRSCRGCSRPVEHARADVVACSQQYSDGRERGVSPIWGSRVRVVA